MSEKAPSRRGIFGKRPFELEYTDVFSKGKTREEIEEDRELGQARIGDERRPNLFSSYMRSARSLIDSMQGQDLDPIAVPLTFTQRHAFELGLKGLIESCRDLINESHSEFARERFHSLPDRAYEVMSRHHLKPLVSLLKRSLECVGVNDLPEHTEELESYFTSCEGNGGHTAWRFEETARGYAHFQKETLLQPVKVQEWLERFRKSIRYEDRGVEYSLHCMWQEFGIDDHEGWRRTSHYLEVATAVLDESEEPLEGFPAEDLAHVLRVLAQEYKAYVERHRQLQDWLYEDRTSGAS